MSTLPVQAAERRVSRGIHSAVAKLARRRYPLRQPTTSELLEVAAEILVIRAATEATGSRDFGRGYMHAVRLLRGE